MIQAILALALACIALGFTSCSYRDRLIEADKRVESQATAIKTQNGAAMSVGRVSTFLDIYIERDLEAGTLTESEAQA